VSVAVTLPLLLLYNVGLLMPGNREMNAADVLTRLVAGHGGLMALLAMNGTLVLLSLILTGVLIRRGAFRPGHWALLCLEGLAYGLALGWIVTWAMGHVPQLGPLAAHSYSIPMAVSVSAGAGYWEEIVFRLVLVGGPIALAERLGGGAKGAWVKVAVTGVSAVVLSSVVFSLAHYLGGTETPDAYSFWYRALSGVVFSSIFLARGFAVAAYTHFLYDVLVFVF
jgi:hypothetical protein